MVFLRLCRMLNRFEVELVFCGCRQVVVISEMVIMIIGWLRVCSSWIWLNCGLVKFGLSILEKKLVRLNRLKLVVQSRCGEISFINFGISGIRNSWGMFIYMIILLICMVLQFWICVRYSGSMQIELYRFMFRLMLEMFVRLKLWLCRMFRLISGFGCDSCRMMNRIRLNRVMLLRLMISCDFSQFLW